MGAQAGRWPDPHRRARTAWPLPVLLTLLLASALVGAAVGAAADAPPTLALVGATADAPLAFAPQIGTPAYAPPTPASATAPRWGQGGHLLVGRAAAERLPEEMPAFFRDAVDRLSWLNAEPDRWRDSRMPEADHAYQYDHFIDLEAIPIDALASPHRFAYLERMTRSNVARPERLGLLPFRILEVMQRLTIGFRQWRAAAEDQTRRWIEERILNDAGILGHFVADAANPHHTTIHFNGWDAESPNPEGYTTDRTFHRRFESDFVNARIAIAQLRPRATAPARELTDPRADVMAFIQRSHARLRRLYDLEKMQTFNASTASPEHRDFALERLAAGAEMLRSVWLTAWRQSQQRR